MNLSQMELEGMGRQAASDYLVNKVPLNDTIIKMASASNLNPHQVARICESANTNVYSTLWGMTKNGQFTFDMADQEKIAEVLNGSSERKLASFLTENDVAPSKLASYLPDEDEVVGLIKHSELHNEVVKVAKVAKDIYREKFSIKKAEKLAATLRSIKEEANDRLFLLHSHRNKALDDLTSEIKSAALRGEDISKAYIACKYSFPNKTEIVKKAFMHVADNLRKYGISFTKSYLNKTAGKIISEDALGRRGIQGINRKHSIIKHLDTICKDSDLICECNRAKDYICKMIEKVDNRVSKIKFSDFEGTKFTDKIGEFEKDALSDTTLSMVGMGTSMLAPGAIPINTGINAYLNRSKLKDSMKGVKMIGGNNFLNGNGTHKAMTPQYP